MTVKPRCMNKLTFFPIHVNLWFDILNNIPLRTISQRARKYMLIVYQGQQKREPIVEQKSRWSWLTRSNGRLVSVGPRWAQIDHVCHRAGHADRDQGWSLLPTTPNYSPPPPTAAPRPTLANALSHCIQISWIVPSWSPYSTFCTWIFICVPWQS